MKFCRKNLVIQKALAQEPKALASKGYPQVDESIYYASSDGEIHATASSKSKNFDSHPTELSKSNYSRYNHLHGFTTSLADADV